MAKKLVKIEHLSSINDFKQPLFDGGRLVYADSGHTLTHVNGFYVCSLKQKGKCENKDEESISVKNFERKFIRHIKNLSITKLEADTFKMQMVQEFTPLMSKILPVISHKEDHMGFYIDAIYSELKTKKNISTNEVATIKKDFAELLKLSYPSHLLLMAYGFIEALSLFENERLVAQGAHLIFDKTYVSDSGAIKKIKLEGLADFTFYYLAHHIPNFMNKWKIPFVDRGSFSTPNFEKACQYFQENDYRSALSYEMYKSKHAEKDQITKIFAVVKDEPPIEKIRFWRFLKDYYSKLGLLTVYTHTFGTYQDILKSFKKTP